MRSFLSGRSQQRAKASRSSRRPSSRPAAKQLASTSALISRSDGSALARIARSSA
jgi:hypothetical protein